MSVLNKPYELSVWVDEWSVNQFVEKRLCTIGANDMVSQSRALNPKLTRKVDGTNTFSFMIYYRYKDNITGEEVNNPFAQYLTNERKLKLQYDNRWYDLIIKNVKVDSTKYTYEITATDQHINELAKNGFNLTFDAELKNNVGNVQTLAQRTLADTDWIVPNANDSNNPGSEFIPDIAKEALVKFITTAAISATRINEIEGQAPTYTSVSIPSGSTIYGFYSCCQDKTSRFQFLYVTDSITKDNERVITNKNCQYYKDDYTYSSTTLATYGIYLPANCSMVEISSEYRGARYVFSPDMHFNSTLNTYVTEYHDAGGAPDDLYYGFSEIEYKAPNLIQNWVTNPNTFKTTSGWTVALSEAGRTRGTLTNEAVRRIGQTNTYTNIMADVKAHDLKPAEQYTPVLHFTSGTKNLLVNSGLYDNRFNIKNLITGQKYVIKLKLHAASTPISNATLYCGTYPYTASTYTYDLNDTYTCFKKTGISISRGGTYTTVVTINAHYTESWFKRQTNNKVNLILSGLSADTYIEDFEMYEAIPDGNGGYLAPEDQVNKAQIITTYYFYDKNAIDNASVNEIRQDFVPIIVVNKEPIAAGYETVLSCEKRRSITIKESNYFNIIQTLCETFECWAEFVIAHDSNGNIQSKKVFFHNYIGQENYAGFRYGVNLKSVSRSDDSKQIVTKLIVKQNSNEFGKNGFCTIQRASSNETGENYLLNFDYYITQGLLSAADVNAQLYQTYYPQLRQYNNLLQQYGEDAANKAKVLAQATANVTEYENALHSATENLQAAADLFLQFFKVEWQDASTLNTEWLDKNIKYLVSCIEYYVAQQQYSDKLDDAQDAMEQLEEDYETIESNWNATNTAKADLLKDLYTDFSRYIQEGTWNSEEYYDDETYYLDAQSTLYNSCVPKVSYSMSVLELSQLSGYEPYSFAIGDRTFVEDPEFFGYDDDGNPIREPVTLTEITYNLDQPEKNSIKIQNHLTQFQDLFKKITATVQSVQYSTGAYEKAAQLAAANDQKKSQYLQGALQDAATILENMAEQTVRIDAEGLTITDSLEQNKALRAVSGGILLTEDGGNTWQTGITAEGVSAAVLTSGTLNTGEVNIMYGAEPSFRWDALGLTAFNYAVDGSGDIISIDPTSGVRFDRLGIYGFAEADGDWHPSAVAAWIKNNNHAIVPSTDSRYVRSHSIFELTKEGLYLDLGRGKSTYNYYYDASNVGQDLPDAPVGHDTLAQLGKIQDVLYNTWSATGLPYYDTANAQTLQAFVKVFSVGRDSSEEFALFDDGVIKARKLYVNEGIAFNDGSGMIKAVYHTDFNGDITAPPANTPYSSFPDTADPTEYGGWHKVKSGSDTYVSLSYNNGTTWEEPSIINPTIYALGISCDNQIRFNPGANTQRITDSIVLTATGSTWASHQWSYSTNNGGSWNTIGSGNPLTWNLPAEWETYSDTPEVVKIKCEATSSEYGPSTVYAYIHRNTDGAKGNQGSPGATGANGTNGTKSEIQVIYVRATSIPSATTTWVTSNSSTPNTNNWTKQDINEVTTSGQTGHVYQATQTRITTYSGPGDTTGTSTVTCTAPVLYKAKHDANDIVSQTTYAEFLTLINNGNTAQQGIYYGPNGNLLINAAYIKTGALDASLITTGALEIKNSNDNILFKADAANPAVQIGSWSVDSNSIYSGSFTGNDNPNGSQNSTNIFMMNTFSADSSKYYRICDVNSKQWVFGAGSNFGVQKNGALYARSGNIAGWTMSSVALYTGTNSSSQAPTLYLGTGNIAKATVINNSDAKTDWRLKISNKFGVDSSGTLYAANANISGTITANLGEVGGFIINTNTLGSNAEGGQIGDNTYYTYLKATVSGTSSTSILTISKPPEIEGGLSYERFSVYTNKVVINDAVYGSDERFKTNIKSLDVLSDTFFDKLCPKLFTLKDSGRAHFGFIAQEVLSILPKELVNQGIVTEHNKQFYLAYNDFTAVNTWQIQKLKARVSELEKRVLELEKLLHK